MRLRTYFLNGFILKNKTFLNDSDGKKHTRKYIETNIMVKNNLNNFLTSFFTTICVSCVVPVFNAYKLKNFKKTKIQQLNKNLIINFKCILYSSLLNIKRQISIEYFILHLTAGFYCTYDKLPSMVFVGFIFFLNKLFTIVHSFV